MPLRIGILLIFLFSVSNCFVVRAQIETPGSELSARLDAKKWKRNQLKNLTIQLPSDFEHVRRQCIHFPCDIFKFGRTNVVVTYGDIPYASDRARVRRDFSEATLKINEMTALVFQYSDNGEVHYFATFPSDQLGLSIATLTFRSKDAMLPDFARIVLETIVFKTKLNGPQRFYVPKVCAPSVGSLKQPMEFEEIKRMLQVSALADEIESRRFFFELTPERESELVKAGASKFVVAMMRKIAREVEEQTKVYDRFTEGYNSRDIEKLKRSLSAGREFLDRWECDPMWQEQVKFIRPWIRRLESWINFSYT